MKNIIKFLIITLLTAALMTGCGSGKQGSTVSKNEEERRKAAVDWQSVTEHIKDCDLSGTGLYINVDQAKEDVKEFGYINFRNYESDFRSVDKQIDVCYGLIMKPGNDSEEYFDGAAFEINVVDNSNYESFYHGVYSENGESLFEEGEWILTENKAETVSGWIKTCLKAMGKTNEQ